MWNNNSYLYVSAAVSLILVLLIIIRLCKVETKIQHESNKRYDVLVDTNKGLVKIDNKALADELELVQNKLIQYNAGAPSCNERLKTMLDTSILNLAEFIKSNPKNAGLLCQGELKADIMHQAMLGSVHPEPRTWRRKYLQVLEWEAHEREMPLDTHMQLEYLIKHLNIAVDLLRGDVCDNGRVDLQRLYHIMSELSNAHCNETPIDDPNMRYLTSRSAKLNPSLPIYTYDKNQYAIEPFESIEATPRKQKPARAIREPPNQHSVDKPFANYSELMGQVESTIGDASIEGSVEKDILGYKPPGHIMGQLAMTDEHYTTRVNSCGGKTVSDDDLWKNCTSHDMTLRKALDGDATEMLGCTGRDCNDPKNYANFYDKVRAGSSVGNDVAYI